MSHTLNSLLGLTKCPVRYFPAVCCQVSTSVFSGKSSQLLNATPKSANGERSCKGCVRYFSLRTSSSTKLYASNKYMLIHLRGVSSPVPSDNVKQMDQHVSVEVVKDASSVSYEEGDWTDEMDWIKSQESKSVLAPPRDASEIDVLAPEIRPSFNLAAYVNK